MKNLLGYRAFSVCDLSDCIADEALAPVLTTEEEEHFKCFLKSWAPDNFVASRQRQRNNGSESK